MKKFDKIVSALRHKNPLPILYQNGYTPDKIKEEIVTTFSPFFKNQDALEKCAINFMVSDWINLLRISLQYENSTEDIKLILETYNKAKEINFEFMTSSLAQLLDDHLETGNKFWSFFNLEVNKKDLELEEFVNTSMKDISDIIEGITKVLLVEQVLVNRIVRNKFPTIDQIKNLKLGNLVDELITNSSYPHIFKVSPDDLKLSDWRNIAAHHTYSIKNKIITCEYGVGDNKRSISITREQLYDVLKQIVRTLEIINISHKIFGYDNIDAIRVHTNQNRVEPRGEIGFLMFASGLTSQGFEIESIDYDNNNKAHLVIKDMLDSDPLQRGIHSSQFLYNLWVLARKPKMIIEYKTANGNLYLTSSCESKICEQIANGQEEFVNLANHVRFD